MGSYEAMRPEGYAAFVQPAFDLFRRRLEDSGACNHHLKLPTDPSQTYEHALANFANEPHRQSAGFAFRRNAVLRKTRWTQFPRQGRRAGSITDDLNFLFGDIDVLKVSIVNRLRAELGEKQDGHRLRDPERTEWYRNQISRARQFPSARDRDGWSAR